MLLIQYRRRLDERAGGKSTDAKEGGSGVPCRLHRWQAHRNQTRRDPCVWLASDAGASVCLKHRADVIAGKPGAHPIDFTRHSPMINSTSATIAVTVRTWFQRVQVTT